MNMITFRRSLAAAMALAVFAAAPAHAFKQSQIAGQTALDAEKALLNNGTLTLYCGTAPTNPDTALSGNTAVATFTFAATAFGADALNTGQQQATASFVASTVTASST
jgi:hypothetical protein